MKIAVFADCHVDHKKHGERGNVGNWDAWDASIQHILDHDYQALIIAGDLFERGSITGETLHKVRDSLHLVTQKTPVIYITGNHELIRVAPGDRSAATILGWQQGIQVCQNAEWVQTNDLRIAAIPWPHNFQETPQTTMLQHLETEASKFNSNEPRLAVCHGLIDTSTIMNRRGSETELAYFAENTATLTAVDRPEIWHHTTLGHVHRRQSLSPTCSYVGSIDRITFADEGQQRGFSELTWDGNRWHETLIPAATRNFATITTQNDLDKQPSGTIVRIQKNGEVNQENLTRAEIERRDLIWHGIIEDTANMPQLSELPKIGADPQPVNIGELLTLWLDRQQTPEHLRTKVIKEATRLGYIQPPPETAKP